MEKQLTKRKSGNSVKSAKSAESVAEKFNRVCDIISLRTGNLNEFCKEVGIGSHTFYEYLHNNETAQQRYARSKLKQCVAIAEECMAIADAPVPSTAQGSYDTGAVQDKRVRIDTRKWLLSKLVPKTFGDHVDLTSGGEKLDIANAPIIIKMVD